VIVPPPRPLLAVTCVRRGSSGASGSTHHQQSWPPMPHFAPRRSPPVPALATPARSSLAAWKQRPDFEKTAPGGLHWWGRAPVGPPTQCAVRGARYQRQPGTPGIALSRDSTGRRDICRTGHRPQAETGSTKTGTLGFSDFSSHH